MIERTESLTRGPLRDDAARGLAGSDVLSDALNVFRVTGAALLRAEFEAPSAFDIPEASAYARFLHPGATRIMVLHIVAEGTCWVQAEGIPRRQLSKGSIIGFPLGNAHRIGAGQGATPIPASNLLPPPPWRELPVLRTGGDGPQASLVCVYLRCDELLSNPILNSLPPVLVVVPDEERDAQWIQANADHIVKEAMIGRAGGECLIARLTELLFIEILRRHIEGLPEEATGWLAALADRHLAQALSCFHGAPERQWTLDDVARKSGMSRTALIESFQRVLDTPPMRYLTLWRLQLAAQSLKSTRKTTAQIADDVGYGSETALSRAFKRETGYAPAEWRRHRR